MPDGMIKPILFGNTWYEQYRMTLPSRAYHLVSKLQEYFQTLNDHCDGIDCADKYRLGSLDFMDFIVRSFHLLEVRIFRKEVVKLGSKHKCGLPWVCANTNGILSRNVVYSVKDLFDMYSRTLAEQKTDECLIRFKSGTYNLDYVTKSAERYGTTKSLFVAFLIYFTNDILEHCGPDCDIVHGFFTNNKKDQCDDFFWDDAYSLVYYGEPVKRFPPFLPSAPFKSYESRHYIDIAYEMEVKRVPKDTGFKKINLKDIKNAAKDYEDLLDGANCVGWGMC
jgi:hypothetical protein